ncbi:MAG: cadmium-translocating P-type ATPase [Clostridia bacterium]|nr:cadmium-translocating P-type ATPase [Clostridia bacterium]
MTGKQKKTLVRIIVSAATLGASFAVEKLTELPFWAYLIMYLVPYFTIGYDVLWRSVRNIARGNVFDENFLMSVATIGAFATGEFAEAVFVMLFYQVGELFQSVAVGRSRKSIAALMDIRPDSACVLRGGEETVVEPDEVEVGETIVVRPGEKIAIDGVVIEGQSSVDTAALTGESVPRSVDVGDEVISGSINTAGLIKIRTEKPFGKSTVSKILELVENASSKKAQTENFISRFAKYYTPSVVGAAVLLAVIPSIITGQWSEWIHRALIFLVVSCPCALVISVPLAYFAGIGGASERGILVKGSNYLEALSKTKTVVFDKTGTLTKGVFRVTEIAPVGADESELIRAAASAEKYSTHPIALSIGEACPDAENPTDVSEISGEGVKAAVGGVDVLAGNARLMKRFNIEFEETDVAGTVVYVALDGKYIGHIVISDEIKPDSAAAIKALGMAGINTVMLSGDKKSVAESVGKELGLGEVNAELLPADKVSMMESIISRGDGKVAFVGDGINDAPVLMRADVGIAMGVLGSDAAIEAADVVLTDDKPSKIAEAIKISKKTGRIVRQNIAFSLFIKGVVLVIGALGIAPMAVAVFADVGVAVIAILNSIRAMKTK